MIARWRNGPFHRGLLVRTCAVVLMGLLLEGCRTSVAEPPPPLIVSPVAPTSAPQGTRLPRQAAPPVPPPAAISPTITPLPRASVVGFDHPGDSVTMVIDEGVVHFLVVLTDLPAGAYDLALENPTGMAVLFGGGNAHLAEGRLVDETTIFPHNGRITLWSLQPVRMLTARDAKIVLRAHDQARSIVRTSAALDPPLPTLDTIIPAELIYATDVISALNGRGLNVQSVTASVFNGMFETTTQAVFVRTNQGVLEIVFFPAPTDSLHIATIQADGRYRYTLSGPLVGTTPEYIDSPRPMFFIRYDQLLLITSTPELAAVLEAGF